MLIVIMPEKKTKFKLRKKKKNYNLRIISKPHARLPTMTKTPVKFQKNQHKTVGQGTHYLFTLMGKMPEKMTEFNLRKR